MAKYIIDWTEESKETFKLKFLKKISFIITLSISFNSISQENLTNEIDYSEEKYDTITCAHFLQANKLLNLKESTNLYNVVDYPILKYIKNKNHCDNIEEHNINASELKYFIYIILTYQNDDKQKKP